MYYIYILYSKVNDRFYTGHAKDVGDRFIRHNQGRSQSTKAGRPWRLLYAEQFETRSQAVQREQQIKSMKSRKYILELLQTWSP